MFAHRRQHFTEKGWDGNGSTGEDGREITKQPGLAETAASDHDTVAARFVHHANRVFRFPDVTVAEHRDRGDVLFQRGDRVPIGRTRIELVGRSCVEGNCGHPFFFADPTRIEIREQIVVEAFAELDRDRNPSAGFGLGGLHGGPND